MELPTSQKTVITLLRKYGALPKRELASRGALSWGTTVKSVEELIAAGFVYSAGTVKNSPGTRGKQAEAYSLAENKPLALGIDVEYRITRVALVNLKGAVLTEASFRTVQHPRYEDVLEFLTRIIRDFAAMQELNPASLIGIGIGIPGIGFPARSPRENLEKAREVRARLEQSLGITVKISQNTNVYAVFQKWLLPDPDFSDFLFVSIRTGVGCGIMHRGELYTGADGVAGEIGHVKVVSGGLPCRCGGVGCLETVVNERYLVEQYRTRVIKRELRSTAGGPDEIRAELQDLFDRSVNGDENATQILSTAARYLGHALAASATILDIHTIIFSGHFGPNGTAMEQFLKDTLDEQCLPNAPLRVYYAPFEPRGYVVGAALLVLKTFFVDVPQGA